MEADREAVARMYSGRSVADAIKGITGVTFGGFIRHEKVEYWRAMSERVIGIPITGFVEGRQYFEREGEIRVLIIANDPHHNGDRTARIITERADDEVAAAWTRDTEARQPKLQWQKPLR